MITIPVELPEDLAKEVLPLQDRLPEIIKLGLSQWRKQTSKTPRQRAEDLWDTAGVVEPALRSSERGTASVTRRRKPVAVGGKTASDMIIENREELP